LKLAKSYVKSGDWDAAIEIWKDLLNDSDKKIARRSTYNMAIASEIKGGLDTAIEWANKAKELGEKKAYNYINVLHIRKVNEEKLNQQLNN
jgi:pentatricopeptide repeat protein